MKTLFVARRIFGFPATGAKSLQRLNQALGVEQAFTQAESARRWVEHREAEARRRHDINPFHFSQDFEQITSMPEEVFHDWLIDHDYPPFDLAGPLGWEDWWEVYAPRFTLEQRERLWNQLDRIRMYDLLEVPWEEGSQPVSRRVWLVLVPDPFQVETAFTGLSMLEMAQRRQNSPRTWQSVPLILA